MSHEINYDRIIRQAPQTLGFLFRFSIDLSKKIFDCIKHAAQEMNDFTSKFVLPCNEDDKVL